MKILYYLFLAFYLTSCSSVYFTDLQTLGGKELSNLPNELRGTWYDANTGYSSEKLGFKKFEINDNNQIIDSTVKELAVFNNDFKLFKSGEYYIANQRVEKFFWDVSIFKPFENGDIHFWMLDEYKTSLKMNEFLKLEWAVFGEGVDKKETFRTLHPDLSDTSYFDKALFSGQLDLINLENLLAQTEPIVLKKEGAILTPHDESFFSTDYVPKQNVTIVTAAKNQNANSRSVTIGNANIESPGTYYALIIGNDNYKDSTIKKLTEAVNDAKKLSDLLVSKYSFKRENVTLLKDASYVQTIEALDKLSNNITPNDNVLIFYAGHGFWDETKKLGYWLPIDAFRTNTAFWLPNSRIADYISSINSKHTLLISDACFSGSIFKTTSRSGFNDASNAVNMLYEMKSRKAMTSGNLTEVPDKSVFLKFLIKRLTENEDKYISTDVLFSSFRQAVLNDPNGTTPLYQVINVEGDEGGEFIFIQKDE